MIHLDFETRSEVDIWKVGAWEYAAHPSTQILCMAYAIDNGSVQLLPREHFLLDLPCPDDLSKAITEGSLITAHNAFFERCVWKHKLAPLTRNVLGWSWGWIRNHRWRCSMAKASACALPKGLKDVGEALGLKTIKSVEGKRIMLKLSKPRKPTKNNPSIWHEDPEDFKKLYEYCKTDVDAERAVDKALPDLSDKEQEVWFLDQIINERGVEIDRVAVDAALSIIDEYSIELKNEVFQLTNGYLDGVSRTARILKYLNLKGIKAENVQKITIDNLLKKEKLPDDVRRVLEIRRQLAKTSIKKYTSMKNATMSENRLRDTLLYHSATTGRWGGKLVQLQNLPRGNIKDTDTCVELIKRKNLGLLKFIYGDVMGAISSSIRGMIIAKPGHDLIVADYSAIEARVLLWLADDKAGLAKYRRDEDLYVDMAQIIYKKDNINEDERWLGKKVVLGCIAEDSMIYSDIGKIPIQTLNQGQRIWDGKKWVNFRALVPTGKKNVIRIEDLWLTPDHLLLTKDGWRTAAEIALSGDMKLLELGSYSEHGLLSDKSLSGGTNAVSLSVANAELRKTKESTNYGGVKQILADVVAKVLKVSVGDDPVDTLISSLIHAYEKGGASVGIIFVKDVLTQIAPTTKGMVLEVFRSALTPVEHSWNTLLHWISGGFGALLWIELIMPKGTAKEIYDSLLKEKTLTTKIKNCYDIADTDNGRFQVNKFIAHNCGYGMGVDKFKTTCTNEGVEVSDELAQRAVNAYRDTYSSVKNLWYSQERAAIRALRHKGDVIVAGRVRWAVKGKFLVCELPSGRPIVYYKPFIKMAPTPWGEMKETIHFWGVDSQTKQFKEMKTYGGKLVENITQATARDIMAAAMLSCEQSGYSIVLTVHDELVGEIPDQFGSVHEFCQIMCVLPEWAEGCPISAEGWRGKRYKK